MSLVIKPMFRARVIISGATDQFAYGKNPDRLMAKAVRLLTVFPPGLGSLFPRNIILERKIGEVSGNQSLWEYVRTLNYEDVPEDQHEWRKAKPKVR